MDGCIYLVEYDQTTRVPRDQEWTTEEDRPVVPEAWHCVVRERMMDAFNFRLLVFLMRARHWLSDSRQLLRQRLLNVFLFTLPLEALALQQGGGLVTVQSRVYTPHQ